jgi:hypothetical protein
MGIEVDATGKQCNSCKELFFSLQEVEQQERAAVAEIVTRGIRNSEEFRFVRKVKG